MIESTSGYVFKLSGGAVSWQSKKHMCRMLTAEVEYITQSAAVQESLRLQQLTSKLTNTKNQQVTILKDNQSAIAITHNPQFHGRSKHIDISTILSEITSNQETSNLCIVQLEICSPTCSQRV